MNPSLVGLYRDSVAANLCLPRLHVAIENYQIAVNQR